MTFLPIVDRELRVAARRGGTYWMRWAAALAALVGAIFIYVSTYREGAKDAGLPLFVALAVLANVYAILAGLRTTADCLSQEKREGTLGLLFLTDLKGYDIVLGKLAATSLNAFYGLLAMFPVMGIPVLLGGVTLGEFGRVALVSVNNLLFSLAVGMFCSSISRDDRKAGLASLLVLLLAALLPVLGMILSFMSPPRHLPHPLFFLPSPSFTCFAAFDATFSTGHYATGFWLSAGLVHGFTWVLLVTAAWIVPRTWQERIPESRGPSLISNWRQWQDGTPAVRAERRRRLLEINPILWLTSRARLKEFGLPVLLAGLSILWLWGYASVGSDWLEFTCIPFALCAHAVLKVWLAAEACRRFSDDRRSGALELLLAAPLSVDTILRGQRLALWRQFAWPTFYVLLADVALMAGGLSSVPSDEETWVILWVAGAGMLVWDLYALSWVSPWMGLNSRSPSRASMAALIRICLLPWLTFGGLVAGYGFLETFFHYSASGRNLAIGFILAWAGVGAAANLGFAGWARHRLRQEFREVATRRYESTFRQADWGRALREWIRGGRVKSRPPAAADTAFD